MQFPFTGHRDVLRVPLGLTTFEAVNQRDEWGSHYSTFPIPSPQGPWCIDLKPERVLPLLLMVGSTFSQDAEDLGAWSPWERKKPVCLHTSLFRSASWAS